MISSFLFVKDFFMFPKKVLIVALIISVFSHILILTMTGFIPAYVERHVNDTMTVELMANPAGSEEKPPENKVPPMRLTVQEAHAITDREDTIELDDTESKYAPYLLLIKQRIETVWSYPGEALHQKVAGTNMLRFTIDRSGALVGVRLLTRSGNNSLDLGSIWAVRSAAPFDPIPAGMNLVRLHIIATFDYRIVD